jgi:NAD(P)H-flavin reductase
VAAATDLIAAEPASAPMAPRRFRVVRQRRDTHDTVTLTMEPVDGPALTFVPGQFTMIGVFGVGEVPISISGDPAHPELLQHTVRDVGNVTHRLVAARPGDVLGIRGPFGTGWDVQDGAGGDVVVVAGGIGLAPLRPAVLQLLADRGRFGQVVVLYGARGPQDVMFSRELEHWRGRFDVSVDVTVDYGPPQWRGRVGLVTGLIPRAGFDPSGCLALVCGPETMMRYVAGALVDRGVPADRIRVSMERNMRCGVGLCGHCQLREFFVCTDGPVIGFDRVRRLMQVREV